MRIFIPYIFFVLCLAQNPVLIRDSQPGKNIYRIYICYRYILKQVCFIDYFLIRIAYFESCSKTIFDQFLAKYAYVNLISLTQTINVYTYICYIVIPNSSIYTLYRSIVHSCVTHFVTYFTNLMRIYKKKTIFVCCIKNWPNIHTCAKLHTYIHISL